jgi:hypothetical protein
MSVISHSIIVNINFWLKIDYTAVINSLDEQIRCTVDVDNYYFSVFSKIVSILQVIYLDGEHNLVVKMYEIFHKYPIPSICF